MSQRRLAEGVVDVYISTVLVFYMYCISSSSSIIRCCLPLYTCGSTNNCSWKLFEGSGSWVSCTGTGTGDVAYTTCLQRFYNGGQVGKAYPWLCDTRNNGAEGGWRSWTKQGGIGSGGAGGVPRERNATFFCDFNCKRYTAHGPLPETLSFVFHLSMPRLTMFIVSNSNGVSDNTLHLSIYARGSRLGLCCLPPAHGVYSCRRYDRLVW
jgi:hypothetical protein